ncbi:MAG: outer membrane beta-barrel family protein [Muribaculaceae bacterium]
MKFLRVTLILFCAFIATMSSINAANVKGCVVNEGGEPVEFATLVILQADKQIAGATTNIKGCFNIEVHSGEYSLKISSMGLSPYNEQLSITNKEIDLGTITLGKSSVMMKEVEVKASAIRREADRFVVNVEDLPTTIGKDGEDLLKQAPGVWISNDKISINGQSGTKVYINDREMKLSDEQLMNYLKSLTAEDMSKIEIIPNAGAEYSADNQGGIIKITLKKNRSIGMMGSAGLNTKFGKDQISLNPHARLNYNFGKWAINASTWWSYDPRSIWRATESTEYSAINSKLFSNSENKNNGSVYGGITFGAFYDIDKKNTVGAEVEYTLDNEKNILTTNSDFHTQSVIRSTLSNYNTKNASGNINARFNYIHKIDTLGSTLKFLANYIYDDNKSNANNYSLITKPVESDSTFRNDVSSRYNVLNAGLDLDQLLSKKWKIKAGAKYTFNNMNNSAYYDYLKNSSWIPSTKYNYDVKYNENILAIYAIANATYGRVSVNAGLRGEYTKATGEGSYIDQSYFDLFPNANINYSFTKKGDYSVNARYSRQISRPSFWALNPVRMQISDYSYQIGNPLLKPAYSNSAGLDFAFAYKYSLSLNYTQIDNAITQVFVSDSSDPRYMNLTFANQATWKNFSISVYAPVDITKWWNTTANITYVRSSQKENSTAETINSNYLFANLSMNFTLPHNFFIEASVFYQNRVRQANLEIEPNVNCGITLKKAFNKNKWVASIGTRDFLCRDFVIKGLGDDFTRLYKMKNPLTIRATVTYNFNAGKLFKERKIESNDDASRMEKK